MCVLVDSKDYLQYEIINKNCKHTYVVLVLFFADFCIIII